MIVESEKKALPISLFSEGCAELDYGIEIFDKVVKTSVRGALVASCKAVKEHKVFLAAVL